MAYGWFTTVNEADTYFEDERLETEAWDDLAGSGGLKEKCLMQAYNRLYYHPDYDLPTLAEATAAELVILKKAQGEMSYYIAAHVWGGDEDARKGIQAQGVLHAGIVKEIYERDYLDKIPIPPIVEGWLAPWKKASEFFVGEIERDENESVDTKVDDF